MAGVATAPRAAESRNRRVVGALFAPTDIAVLVYFRMAFGLLMTWDALHAFREGRVHRFVHAQLLFKYWPFTFVKPLPSPLLTGVYIVLGVAGIFMAVGLYYRASAIAIFVVQTYVFLLDAGVYLNHMYLVCLLAFLMIFLPANRRLSIDTRFEPSLRSDTVPAWTIWLLQFQIAVPYVFGGINKLNADFYRGTPLRELLLTKQDFPLLGQFFTNATMVDFLIWGSLLLDLLVVFLLLNRRTRVPAYAAALVFHIINSRIFNINIFPWLMIAATAIFFPPDWPRRLVADARAKPRPDRFWRFVIGFVVVGSIASYVPPMFSIVHTLIGGLGGGLVGYFVDDIWTRQQASALSGSATDAHGPDGEARRTSPRRTLVLWLLGVWVAFQILVPLRHWVMSDNVYWTTAGQRFSWYMMLRNKTGTTIFVVRNPHDGETFEIDAADVLDGQQLSKMTGTPDLTVEFAHFLRDKAREGWHIPDPEVRVRTMISLNLRPEQVFIDPNVDLAKVELPLGPLIGHPRWILPLKPRDPHAPQGRKLLQKYLGEQAG
jgi:HTTM domain/Vitamin K-dependent gamma-carboxylase, lumenal domain